SLVNRSPTFLSSASTWYPGKAGSRARPASPISPRVTMLHSLARRARLLPAAAVLALALAPRGGTAVQAAPDVSVSAPGYPNVVSGQSAPVDFGTGTLAVRKDVVFTVKNTGTTTVSLIDPTTHGYPSITLPAGFTLSKRFGATSLAPGA